jgi:hypothetical protein
MQALNRAELGTLRTLVIVLATVLVVACSSKTSRDADWEEVQKVATRVESGLRHETLIALRSKVADLDAAISNYTRHHADGQKEQRVRSINQAVDALEWGIDHEKADVIWDGTDGFDFYSARQYLNAEPHCAESEGKLYIAGHDLSVACLAYAQSALLEPDKPPLMSQRDFNALRSKCSSDHEKYQQQTQEKAAAARAKHLRDWPLQVDIACVGDSRDTFSFKLEIDDGDQSEGLLFSGQHKYIDAKRKVRIFIDDWSGHIFTDDWSGHPHPDYQRFLAAPRWTIKVNGRTWTPEWTKTRRNYLDYLETTITLDQ